MRKRLLLEVSRMKIFIFYITNNYILRLDNHNEMKLGK